MLGEDLSLGMITNDLDVDKAPNIEPLGSEHRHLEGWEGTGFGKGMMQMC